MACRIIKLILISLFFALPAVAFGEGGPAQEKIDINTATLEQLETLTGVGPVYAQRIIDARPFSLVDDLLRVSGIGEKTLQKIKDQGLAYVKTPEATIPEETPPPNIQDISYPKGIFIIKIMPSPEGADADKEYIELKNTNDFEVDLTNWLLRDKQGSIEEYTLKEKIPALGNLTLLRPQTKITLNNSGDGIELLNPLKEIVDLVDFGKAETGIAFVKTSSGWKWDIVEPNNENVSISAKTKERAEVGPRPSGIEIDLSNKSEKPNFSIYLTAVLVAFLASVIFFVFKKKLYKDQYIEN